MNAIESTIGALHYRNYRNVRAVAVFYIILGVIFTLGTVVLLAAVHPDPERRLSPATKAGFAVFLGAFGAAGVLGGFATLRGDRGRAKLVYAMAVLYLSAFPLGTILGLVMLTGLHRYLDSMDRLRDTPGRAH